MLTLCLVFSCLTLPAYAATVTLAWNASTSSTVTGYRVYWGLTSGTYTSNANAGNQTSYPVTGLTVGQTYYFAVKAYDAGGQQSGFSNQVQYTVPSTTLTANFSASPTSGTAPLTVAFTNTTTGSATSWAWTFGDGGTSSAQHPSHTYSAAGTYTVKLTATGSGGSNTVTKTNLITVGSGGGSSTGLVAAYSFENGSGTTLSDVSGNNNHGTITGATWTIQGRFGKALSFDGVNDWVTVADKAALDLGTTGTIEAWVRLNTLGRWHGLIAKGNTNSNAAHNYALEVTNGNVIRCILGTGTTSVTLDGSAITTTGQFRHVACTWDGTTMRVYLDGALKASRTQTLTPVGNTAPLFLGQFGGNSDRLAGTLDDVRIYNRARTATQIQTDMQTAVSTSMASPTAAASSTTLMANTSPTSTTGTGTGTATASAPVANFSATTTTGPAPLTVTFSNTTTGNATAWSWSFGDGASSNVQYPSHTYSAPGTYTVRLTATGPEGSHAATRTDFITVTPAVLEVGEIEVNHVWTPVTLRQTFVTPIVVAHALSRYGTEPATVRIRNVTPTGFEIHVEEWNYLNGSHMKETIGYIVLEQGQHTIDGVQVEAGSLQGNWTTFGTVAFTSAFSIPPVVLTTVATTEEAATVTTQVQDINTTGFQVRMQEQAANTQEHVVETINYVAWVPSVGIHNGIHFEVQRTPQVMTHAFHTIQFTTPFMNMPVFLAAMQTTADVDPTVVRWTNLDLLGVDVQLQEEQSTNKSLEHSAEIVGYFVFAFTESTPPTGQ